MRYIDRSKCKSAADRGIDSDIIQTRELTRDATRIAEYLKLGLLKTRDGYYRVIRESGLGSPEHADAIFDTLAEVDSYLKSLAPKVTGSANTRSITSSYFDATGEDTTGLNFRGDIQSIEDALEEFEDFCFDTLDKWENFVSQSDRKSIWNHIVSIRNTLDYIIEESRRQDLLPYE